MTVVHQIVMYTQIIVCLFVLVSFSLFPTINPSLPICQGASMLPKFETRKICFWKKGIKAQDRWLVHSLPLLIGHNMN